MHRSVRFILIAAGSILMLLLTVCAFTGQKEIDNLYQALFSRNTRIFTPPLPGEASFSGEAVPLNRFYVREALDREIMSATYMHSTSIMMFKRANRWFPVIEPILKKYGVPDDFKFLAVAESNLANVVSPAKAEGFWQFLKSTGTEYGLEINEHVDERYHLEKATEAACAYLLAAKRKFGSWTLAAASYNRGSEGLGKAIENQMVDNYYDLFLNEETSRYIFRIIAAKEIYNHPVRYGFYLKMSDFYPPVPFKTVEVDTSVASLPAFAKKHSVTFRILRELNPWIRGYALPVKPGKKYLIRIPEKTDATLEPALQDNEGTFFHDTLKINELR